MNLLEYLIMLGEMHIISIVDLMLIQAVTFISGFPSSS